MDERLRRLERASANGDTESRARWLRERVRAGELSRAKLELAARAGDPAALAAVGAVSGCLDTPAALADFLRGLYTAGQEACVRAGLAALRVALHRREEPEARSVVIATERWLQSPDARCRRRVKRAQEQAESAVVECRRNTRRARILNAADHLASTVEWTRPRDDDPERRYLKQLLDAEIDPEMRAVRQAAWDTPEYVLGNCADATAMFAAQVADPATIAASIRRALIDWALAVEAVAPTSADPARGRRATRTTGRQPTPRRSRTKPGKRSVR